MQSFTTLATICLLAIGALARPHPQSDSSSPSWGYCLTKSEAQQIATNYGVLIANYSTALADAALSPNFTDYSESVNTLINQCSQGAAALQLPLLAPTFTNRTTFEIGQGQQEPINFNQLNIWHSCDTVIIRWETTNTTRLNTTRPVIGMISMETIAAPAGNLYPYYIDTVYSEFDAGAWLENLQDAGICSTNTTLKA
ncbi:hypothetical protein BAUCODRAFT_419645 [Baudoinia panamericana UAMH 10762]|uniref:NTF2-like domain-containing protein n=1 Tax=Baudoinia panamericana (strain UAMH 10762) TaxID=717646 RepID=M2NGZ0_BAUPA|nr:uncharacterized protein BAUCODRAFT_419645 [Baudoinia panamericana UAMH 10762]EMC98285.1 hypothetical protein BAUCODRAFT_419645 [Baudoinia panamericana UAMH 10762]